MTWARSFSRKTRMPSVAATISFSLMTRAANPARILVYRTHTAAARASPITAAKYRPYPVVRLTLPTAAAGPAMPFDPPVQNLRCWPLIRSTAAAPMKNVPTAEPKKRSRTMAAPTIAASTPAPATAATRASAQGQCSRRTSALITYAPNAKYTNWPNENWPE